MPLMMLGKVLGVEDPAKAAVEVTQWATKIGIEWGGKILGVIVLLIIAWMLGGWARRAVGRLLDRPQLDKTVGRFLGNLARWIVFGLAVIACLGFFGFNITSVAALVGAAGLTIGLALQGSLANLAAGIMLLVLRPFKIGDVVQLAGQIGKIDDIDLFNTKIDTGDNRRLIIPNGQIFGNTIENITHHAWRRCDVNVGTAYNGDLKVVRSVLRKAALSIVERDPAKDVDVVLQGLGTHSIEWTVRVWVPTASFMTCRDRLLETIKDELDRVGVSIPFPQMEVWFRNPVDVSRGA
jgi:small conductance mechanosensitive channel